ncbi:GntR family transcriptional regulator [Amycolatopsis sp. DSM 110486]|uniref:GntR family transcriptional regulator n=1 Tax=Amycolatopsis sp. DSM 110486 TaxID=2865832 RepID=UPI001C69B93A|nr:winged helix-turn-helix domain-containing protein [Amycolatopsis sp. DSM 110486]QYN23135.1 winged helix-turn-helix domain-containing protein [Amycolatopsis sp. DSM 110486]
MEAEPRLQAPFEQVAEKIAEEIRSGTYALGAKLPNQRDLAERYEVAIATLQKALGLLRERGWVNSRAPVGTFVAASIPDTVEPAPSLPELSAQVKDLQAEVASLRKSVDDLRAARS